MHAAVLMTHGLDGIAVRQVDRPAPGPGDVLIEVETVGVNQLDLNVIAGHGPGAAARLPRVLGIDPAGTVVEVGSGVDPARVGSRVVVKPNVPCGACHACMAGRESNCPAQQVVGVHRDGGAARYVAVPAVVAFDRGDLSAEQATAAVHSVPIVLNALETAGVEPGERLLVTGAGGTLGRVAVQLAHHLGARVVAASRNPIDGLPPGVEDLVTGPEADLAGALARATAPAEPFDVVIDVGGSARVLADAIAVLGWGGRAVLCAGSVDTDLRLDSRAFYLGRRRLIGVASADLDQVRRGLGLVADGASRPAIAARYCLADIASAYREFPAIHGGKVLIDVHPSPEPSRTEDREEQTA
ncbi:alcohol dehydrogenase catalytic domain-containing protein [Agromyces sp. LHK192]|uniref:alcohol dehydrogenase catalytic domain-containing protein n=1 Tax=Agromyces sp. LHK192 TaxID=2498704 RepID=UPI000FD733CA|nr:alcohol dehydrogenase catalytic domain-containing protein [Agromyces sp. LHK192]